MPTTPHLAWRRLPAQTLAADTELQHTWDRLNAERLDLSFLSAYAVNAALGQLGDGSEQLAVATSNAGDTVALLLLVRQGRLRWATFQPSQLPLGAWVAVQGLQVDELVRSLLRGTTLGPALALSVSQVDPLQAPRSEDGSDNRHTDYISTAWLEIEGSFGEYWAARGKNLRQNLRKQRNKLAADGVTTTLRQWRAPAEMASAIGRYGALESGGWKADRGTAIHPDNAQGRFYTQLMEAAAGRGEALVTEYLFGDRTVAMNFGLVRGGTWVVLKTTYDETIPKALSPASLLREEELQFIFGQGEIRRLEYYGRAMEWHNKLTDRQRTLYHLTGYRWPWIKALAERRARAQVPAAAPEPRGAEPDAPATQTAQS